ncbi:MAG: DUF1214 domain-containing protein [Pseudomonadota bacterium]
MRATLVIVAIFLASFIAGGAYALRAAGVIGNAGYAADIDIDGWRANPLIGTQAADPRTRAYVARRGLMALSQSEVVYFVNAADSEGRPLLEACAYEVSGGAMPAGWWSITLYDEDSRLPLNDDDALSINAEAAGDADWTVRISTTRPSGDGLWLSSRNASQFDLTLRLYRPEGDAAGLAASDWTPPRISRLQCRGDQA